MGFWELALQFYWQSFCCLGFYWSDCCNGLLFLSFSLTSLSHYLFYSLYLCSKIQACCSLLPYSKSCYQVYFVKTNDSQVNISFILRVVWAWLLLDLQVSTMPFFAFTFTTETAVFSCQHYLSGLESFSSHFLIHFCIFEY